MVSIKTNVGQTKEALALAGGTQTGYVSSGNQTYTATTVTPTSSPSWGVNAWAGKLVVTASQVYGVIVSNTATALTVDQWYNPASPTGSAGSTPAANTAFIILGGAAPVNVMALTNTASFTPVATDTSLSGEQTANGLGRKFATFTYTTGTSSYQNSATWTYTGSSAVTLTGAATFDCLTQSSGVMLHESAFSGGSTAVVSVSGDQVTATQTVSM